MEFFTFVRRAFAIKMNMGRKLLLEHAQVPGINTYEVYRKHGGYRSVEKALKTMSPTPWWKR